MTRILHTALAFGLFLAGCDVPEPRRPTGAGRVDAALPPGDATSPVDGSLPVRCDRGVVVVEEPVSYDSTNVALVAESGRVLQGSIASSATSSVGLTAPLSKDAFLPTAGATGDEIVLVDRDLGAGRIIWVDIATAHTRELSVEQGFWSNPYDYGEISRTKAYVARYGANLEPTRQPFDRGSDVLVIDPSKPAIVASIDLGPTLGADAARALPRPARLFVLGARAFVLLSVLPTDFSANADSRLVTVETATDAVTDVLVLDGFRNCAGLAVSPTGMELSVLCSGEIGQDQASSLEGSGVVVIDVTGVPRIARTFPGADLAAGPVGAFGDYASPSVLVFQTFGYTADVPTPAADDTLVRLDLRTGAKETLLRSAGTAFTLGGIACDTLCRVCFAADAGRQGGVVHRFTVDDEGRLGDDRAIKVEENPGYPPRYLGRF